MSHHSAERWPRCYIDFVTVKLAGEDCLFTIIHHSPLDRRAAMSFLMVLAHLPSLACKLQEVFNKPTKDAHIFYFLKF